MEADAARKKLIYIIYIYMIYHIYIDRNKKKVTAPLQGPVCKEALIQSCFFSYILLKEDKVTVSVAGTYVVLNKNRYPVLWPVVVFPKA